MTVNARIHKLFFKEFRQVFKRNVSVLSPLAHALNKLADKKPTTDSLNVGLFGIPELSDSDGFTALKENVLRRANGLVDRAIQVSPSVDVVTIFDSLSNELCKVADLAEFIRLAHPNQHFAGAAENTSFEIGGYVEKLNTHFELYKSIQDSLNQKGEAMDVVTKMVAELFIFDFEQSGIHLEENKRKLAVSLHEAVIVLGARFTQGTSVSRICSLKQWPTDLQIPYHIEKNDVIVDSLYSESSNPRLREHCFKAYMSDCSEQSHLFENLLYARDKLAVLLGFDSFAERTLKGTTAGTPDRVLTLLENTLGMLQRPLKKELDLLKSYKSNCDSHPSNICELNPWDIRYYSNLFTTQTYNISSSKTREYFSIGACMEGLNIIFNALYGVTLNLEASLPGETWVSEVVKFVVRHEKEGVLGHIYCDFYHREGKLPQDCHFTVRGGKQMEDGSYQTPIISLNYNFPPPTREVPSLLSQGMVENLFHEMGHAMHSMLGRARYQHVTGTRCATDFAEVPSVLMEYFAMDERILPLYARHYKTGETLPTDIISKLCHSRKQFAAIDLQTQAFYAIVDQTLHGRHPLGKPVAQIIDDLCKTYSPAAVAPGTSWHLRFSHFHSYAAKYYSYVWSKAVASKVWHTYFHKDPLSRSAGELYREKMLRHGGGKPPQKMVNDMLNKNVTVNDLVMSLENDLER